MSRNTIQRALTLQAVRSLKNHATAEEIFAQIALSHPSISRATIYRNLNLLANSRHIRKIAMPFGADRFDHDPLPHHHLRCEKCGKLYDMEIDLFPDPEKIASATGIKITGYDIIFYGICPECARNRKDRKDLEEAGAKDAN